MLTLICFVAAAAFALFFFRTQTELSEQVQNVSRLTNELAKFAHITDIVAETEKHLRAAQRFALAHDAQNFIESHGFRANLVRCLAKSAITAKIPAQIGQRDKNLRRESDRAALVQIAQRRRDRKQ